MREDGRIVPTPEYWLYQLWTLEMCCWLDTRLQEGDLDYNWFNGNMKSHFEAVGEYCCFDGAVWWMWLPLKGLPQASRGERDLCEDAAVPWQGCTIAGRLLRGVCGGAREQEAAQRGGQLLFS